MRKLLSLLSICIFVLGALSGCGNNEAVKTDIGQPEATKSTTGQIEVDKKLTSVEVTLPLSLLSMDGEEVNYEEIIENAKEEGIDEITKNEDGSITYKMSKAKHKETMDELNKTVLEMFEEITSGNDFESIKEIKSNKNFSEIEVIVDRERFENSFDGFGILGIVLQSMVYQGFDGIDPDNNKVKIDFRDIDTKEIFNTAIYPDAFENI